MDFIIKSLEEFNSLPEEIKKRIGGIESLASIKVLEEKYQVELSFVVILISIGTLKLDDIEEYLMKKFNFNEEDADNLKADLLNHVFSSLVDGLDDLGMSLDKMSEVVFDNMNSQIDDSFEFDDELSDDELISAQGLLSSGELLNILETGLLDHLTSEQDFNIIDRSIIMQVTLAPDFQISAQKSILINKERIGKSQINLGDRRVYPTISNWIKDLIKNIGSEMFDSLKLLNYLNFNQNLKSLSAAEKDMLHRALRLYRRIYFFPDDYDLSVEIDDVLSEEPKEIESEEAVRVEKKTPDRKPVAKESVVSKSPPAPPTKAPKKISPSIVKDKNLEELEDLLKQYPSSSLEHKTIQQEIKKYLLAKKKNNKK